MSFLFFLKKIRNSNQLLYYIIFSADGDYQITTQTKATIHYDGKIIWEPPMIYKSYCAINIEYYPFDIQDCVNEKKIKKT